MKTDDGGRKTAPKTRWHALPAEVLALRQARGSGKGGRKTSVYLREDVLDLLDEATIEWSVPTSLIINLAVRHYLEKAGFGR